METILTWGRTMNFASEQLVDWAVFERTRNVLGANFYRAFGYLIEDGERSITFAENAIRELNAAQLVLPAHCIKGEALHFGGHRLAKLAAHVEYSARDCVEMRIKPNELIAYVAHLRPLFNETMGALTRTISPLREKRRAAS